MAFEVHSLKKVELPFKMNLANQIERIAELFSQKVEIGLANIAISQSILIDSQSMAVDTLETMLEPYLDENYHNIVDAMIISDRKRDNQKNAMKKFGLLIRVMARNHMLIEGVLEDVKEGEAELDMPIDSLVDDKDVSEQQE